MRCFKLTIAYDGTAYSGWQVQPNGVSIQQLIEESLQVILREKVKIGGSGRTDAGVHANGQTAHFNSETTLPAHKILGSLNGLLPQDIRILACDEQELGFHAQYNVKSKIYRYHLHLNPVADPFNRLYAWHIRFPLDLDKLQQGINLLIGTHDFTSFANEAHTGVAAHDPVRTLHRIDILKTPGGIILEFEADGFLYKMVRNLVGTLIEIASGKRDPITIPALFEQKDRRQAGYAAPPQGLFLHQVNY